MNMLRRALLAAPLLLAVQTAWALEAKPYLTATEFDLMAFLPPPTQAGTPQDAAEQQAVIAAQRDASPARIARAEADAAETVYAMFHSVLGDRFVEARLPLASALFARVGETEDAVVDPIKKRLGRVRPFMANPEQIKPLIRASRSGAYPSGHTTRVTLTAVILSAMLPEHQPAIWVRAQDYAESRVVGGMHYPQDLDGGRRAGTAIAAVLMTNPSFMAEYGPARAELRAALGF